jgi:hypothetical protein
MTKYGNKKPIPSARMLFKNENDYNAVKKYVEESLHQKGFTEQQISLVLKKKGWTDQQINGVIAEVKNAKPGAKPGLGIAKPGFINPGKPSLPQKPQEVHKL